MGKTSTDVKRRYNDKTYKRWFADLRQEDFEMIETLRSDLNLSRTQLLKMLIEFYKAQIKEKATSPIIE